MKPQMIRWKRLRAGVGSCEKIIIIFDLYNVLPHEAHCLFVLHHTPDEDFSLERPPLLPMLSPDCLSNKRKQRILIKSKPLQKFSYPAKEVTIATRTRVTAGRLPRETRDKLINRATELVGIVPFDWEMLCGGFVIFFGVDTIELALAAQGRLQGVNLDVRFLDRRGGVVYCGEVGRTD